jgi:hypothetical protein
MPLPQPSLSLLKLTAQSTLPAGSSFATYMSMWLVESVMEPSVKVPVNLPVTNILPDESVAALLDHNESELDPE